MVEFIRKKICFKVGWIFFSKKYNQILIYFMKSLRILFLYDKIIAHFEDVPTEKIID